MIKYFKSRLFWKFFLSYFFLVFFSMLIFGMIVRVLLPGVFNSHQLRMAALLAQHGLDDGMPMMGSGNWMMSGGSVLFRDLFAIFNQIILEAALYAVLPSLGIALVVSAGMSRRFVSPLQQMSQAADHIAEGNYHERLPIGKISPEDSDEMEHLAARFNRMAARLEKTEEMRQKLIGDIAHELRTPLTVISGAMEGLKDHVLDPNDDTFAMIFRQTERLDRLVNDLQELNRIETKAFDLNFVPVEINALLVRIVNAMQINFQKKGVGLMLDLPKCSLPVFVDEDRFDQIMINLLSNALRYTPKGGRVRVYVEEKDGEAEISVQDTGEGIPEEHLSHIFSRFYRVDNSRSREAGGSGIGLTIVKKLVEAHNGKVWAESDGLGKGSVFHFTLPTV